MLQPDNNLFAAFGLHSVTPLVFGFAITELYAAQFDRIAVLGKLGLFRWMGQRADRFAAALVGKSVLKRMIIKSALFNERPLSFSLLYQLVHSDRKSVVNRIANL